MSVEIAAIILFASAPHAGWNALIKISGDRVAVMAVMTIAGSILSMMALPFVDNPSRESWPFLALIILLHAGYSFFLAIAYDHALSRTNSGTSMFRSAPHGRRRIDNRPKTPSPNAPIFLFRQAFCPTFARPRARAGTYLRPRNHRDPRVSILTSSLEYSVDDRCALQHGVPYA